MTRRYIHAFSIACHVTLVGCSPGDGDLASGSATDTALETSSAAMTGETTASPTGTSTGPEATTEGLTTTSSTTEIGTGSDTGGDSEAGDACEYSTRAPPPYYIGNASYAWADPVDELCTVSESAALPGGLELRMDCPIHAMQNAGQQVEVLLQSGPMPGVAPQVGEVLHVFYQLGGDDVPRPGLLFLHRDGQLVYFAVNGFFVFSDDVKNANKYSPPLEVNLRPGSCPLVANPLWQGSMTGFVCEHEALARMEFVADGPALVLTEGMSGEIQAGAFTYAVDVRLARMGEHCGELELIQRQTVAGALVAP